MTKVVQKDSLVSGLDLRSSGKVRDTYLLPDHPGFLLVVASERISAFDFVLPATVKDKGEVLTAMNIFWRQHFLKYRQDLVAFGPDIDRCLPLHLQGNSGLQRRAIVVERLDMIPVECVARGYLTGSGWKSYEKTGEVCGHSLPEGLHNGSMLPEPIFTPTTKATVGHDEPLDVNQVRDQWPQLEKLTLEIYEEAKRTGLECGVIIAETKLEFGRSEDKTLHLADEVLTPDSSRFWDYYQHEEAAAKRKSPPSHDKQFVRNHAKELGVEGRNPASESDRAWVQALEIPEEILIMTSAIYHGIFKRLVRCSLVEFQRHVMGINLDS